MQTAKLNYDPIQRGGYLSVVQQDLPFKTTAEAGTELISDSHFIFSQSCMEVGGDFHHMVRDPQRIVVCIGDAMGHGNEGYVVAEEMKKIVARVFKHVDCETPGYLLKYCNLLFNLSSIGRHQLYGRTSDLAICHIDLEKLELKYSSARIKVILLRDGVAKRLGNDRFPVGDPDDFRFEITSHTVPLQKNDRLFVFTDGVCDQFGGSRNKKLGNRLLLSFLSTLDGTPAENKRRLRKFLTTWQSSCEQTDDMTLIGIAI